MFPAKKVPAGGPASALIDEKIEALDDWRGKALANLRKLIHQAVPEVIEEWKWGTPVWSHGGIICTGEVYKAAVKLTFPKGASLDDPSRLFNSSLEGNVRRAIDVREGDRIDGPALKALFRAAAALNLTAKSKPKANARVAKTARPPQAARKKAPQAKQARAASKPRPSPKAGLKATARSRKSPKRG